MVRVTLLCREHSSSRSDPISKALSALPEGAIIGPVPGLHVSKILDRCCIEVVTESVPSREYTIYVVTAREEERFVDEIHDHK